MLEMMARDRVIVIESNTFLWYGQNERTHKFGKFPRSSVFVNTKSMASNFHRDSAALGGNSKISLPIRGSFIHAAHGDVLGNQSWGTPEKIDDVYLKNPILGDPVNLTMMPLPIPSATNINNTAETILSGMPSTSKAKHVDYEDPFDTAAFDENFSPTKIKLPEVFTTGRVAPLVPSTNISIERPRPSSSRSSIISPNTFIIPSENGRQERAQAQIEKGITTATSNMMPSTSSSTNDMFMWSSAPKESGVVRLPLPKGPANASGSNAEIVTDPFEVSKILNNAVLRERYNNILEKKALLVASQSNSSLPSLPFSLSDGGAARRSESASVPVSLNPSSSKNVSFSENTLVRTRPEFSTKQQPATTINSNKLTRPQSVIVESRDHPEVNVRQWTSRETGDLPIDRSACNGSVLNANSELLNRTTMSSSALDDVRKKRVENVISSVLPKPSPLFFGNPSAGSGLQMRSAETISQTPIRSGFTNSARPSQNVLNLDGVLEPIRLPTSISISQTSSSSSGSQPLLRHTQQVA
ncbi:unnamed protein product [Strongylus vulgaris]|uniref:Cdc42 binding domain-containing protein n=1 Tax=Strongylus vulgaris TaxID=40348 RepID=A0A3P7J4Z5_STRVU|nr:unnamed protein product [Strongylus vulgaris]